MPGAAMAAAAFVVAIAILILAGPARGFVNPAPTWAVGGSRLGATTSSSSSPSSCFSVGGGTLSGLAYTATRRGYRTRSFGTPDSGESLEPELEPELEPQREQTTSPSDKDEEKSVGISDMDMSALYARISKMRDQDYELDKTLTKNWRYGICTHDVVASVGSTIQHISFEGDFVAFGTMTGENYVFQLSTGSVVNGFMGHEGAVTAIEFDGEYVFSGGDDGSVLIQQNDVTCLKREELGPCIHTLRGHTRPIVGLARLDKKTLVSADAMKIILWDIETGEVIKEAAASSPMLCMQAADGFLAVGRADGTVAIHSAKTLDAVMTFDAHGKPNGAGVRSLHFPNEFRLYTGGMDGSIKFWDLKEGGSPKEDEDGELYWDIGGRKFMHIVEGHEAPVISIQADEVKCVSGGADGIVRVCDTKTGMENFRIEGHVQLTKIQFDRTKLVTDGTSEALVCHDFSKRSLDATTI